MSHNVGTRLFSGFLVSFASGVDKRNCWMKQQSNTQKQGHLQLSKLAVWVLCTGSQSLTALNRWGMLVFNEEYYLECFKSYDTYKKIM